jgi:hypothetical protein
MSQLVAERLDSQTRREWQIKQTDEEFPSLNELITSMEQKFQVLETLKPSTNIANIKETEGRNKQRRSPRDSQVCSVFSKSHHLFECTVFLSAYIPQKRSWVQELQFFYNCLLQGHIARTCRSRHCRNYITS